MEVVVRLRSEQSRIVIEKSSHYFHFFKSLLTRCKAAYHEGQYLQYK